MFFFQFMGCLFILSMFSIETQNLSIYVKCNLSIFSFMDHAFGVIFMCLPNPGSQRFYAKSIIVWYLTFWYDIFWITFLCFVWSNGIFFFYMCYPIVSGPLVEKTIFSLSNWLLNSVKHQLTINVKVFWVFQFCAINWYAYLYTTPILSLLM